MVAERGLSIVSDDSALLAAIDEAIAADGKADAPRVRELILERLT